MKAKITVSIGIGALLLFFQNCGNVRFSDMSADQSSAKLTAMSLDVDEQDMSNIAEGQVAQQGDVPPPSAPPTVILPPATSPADRPQNSPPTTGDNVVADDDSSDDDNSSDDNSSDDEDDGLVACILVQHGKSLKLGLIEQKLGGVNSVARSVCITRTGCLDLVSAKFEVEGAYDRGYCKGNPNVVRLTDAQLIELLK